jgi:hypothetical protein
LIRVYLVERAEPDIDGTLTEKSNDNNNFGNDSEVCGRKLYPDTGCKETALRQMFDHVGPYKEMKFH